MLKGLIVFSLISIVYPASAELKQAYQSLQQEYIDGKQQEELQIKKNFIEENSEIAILLGTLDVFIENNKEELGALKYKELNVEQSRPVMNEHLVEEGVRFEINYEIVSYAEMERALCQFSSYLAEREDGNDFAINKAYCFRKEDNSVSPIDELSGLFPVN